MQSKAIVHFSDNWQQLQEGELERGGKLVIDYAKERLSCCFRDWRGAEIGEIMVYLRFHPRGEVVSGSVINAIRAGGNTQGSVIGHESALFETDVPSDATQVEIWFHHFSQTSSRCDAWDSRFGANYWFEIGGA